MAVVVAAASGRHVVLTSPSHSSPTLVDPPLSHPCYRTPRPVQEARANQPVRQNRFTRVVPCNKRVRAIEEGETFHIIRGGERVAMIDATNDATTQAMLVAAVDAAAEVKQQNSTKKERLGGNEAMEAINRAVRGAWGGEVKKQIIREFVDENKLDPFEVDRALDQNPHSLNGSAVGLFYDLFRDSSESLSLGGKLCKKYSMVCSKSSVRACLRVCAL